MLYYRFLPFEKELLMNRWLIVPAVMMILFAGCSSKPAASSKPVAGTPAYDLAKALVTALPAADPEKNTVLVQTKTFTVTVNDVLQMFYSTMGSRTEQLKSLDAARLKTIFEDAAQQIAEKKILLAAAAEAKVAASPEEIKAALDAQYAQAGGETQFAEMVKSQGVALESIKSSVADSVTLNKYLQGVLSEGTKISEADLKKAYESDKTASVRHILLLTQGKTESEKAEVRKKMEGILTKAKAGEDFAGLAKEFSEDPGSKDNGGLYEDYGRGKWVKPFEDAAFSVPVGQISDIVETTYGYHVIKVENRKKETAPFDQVKAEIETQLKESKQAAGFETILSRLKDKAKFKIVAF
jgi:foldase protein PrsA